MIRSEQLREARVAAVCRPTTLNAALDLRNLSSKLYTGECGLKDTGLLRKLQASRELMLGLVVSYVRTSPPVPKQGME